MPNTQNATNIPQHVGIIMDGNGRWAAARGLPRNAGHREGAEAFGRIARHAEAVGVRFLTVYAFSTENWSRPKEEVDGIMNLLRNYLKQEERYRSATARLNVLGDVAPLAPDLREKIAEIQERSRNNPGMTINMAINYGGRADILRAAKNLLHRCKRGEIADIDSLTEADFAAELYTAGQPDVDLIIRTSGELRSSNFLIWQGAYAEYVFPRVLWPDFTPALFDEAVAEYGGRSRRMGGI